MIASESPCRKPECINKNKLHCADDCPELLAYQLYLARTHDPYMAQRADVPEDAALAAGSNELMLVAEFAPIEI